MEIVGIFLSIWNIFWAFGILFEHLEYCLSIWNIVWAFGIFYGIFVYLMAYWYSFWSFGIYFSIWVWLDQERSGNPDVGKVGTPNRNIWETELRVLLLWSLPSLKWWKRNQLRTNFSPPFSS
jgi:hypothetical protein